MFGIDGLQNAVWTAEDNDRVASDVSLRRTC